MIQFAQIVADHADVERGLDRVWRSAPLWPIEPRYWRMVVAAVQSLADRWGDQALACGWSVLQLYGMDASAPAIRREAMGAFFVAARSGDRVLSVTAEAIQLESFTGARSRIYRGAPDPRAVLAWRLCELRSAPGVR